MKFAWLKTIPLIWFIYQGSWLPSANAQSDLIQDLQNWDMVTVKTAFGPGKRFLGYMEAQSRVGNLDNSGSQKDDFSALLIRPALGYQINKRVSVWQGYAWTPTFQPRSINENRIFQQVQVESNPKKFKLTNRTRLEERWIKGTHGTSVRLRDMVRAAYPIGKSERWSMVGYNELFVNLNSVDNGPSSGIDQNRAFIGINHKWNQHVNAEAGYLNQWLIKKDPVADHMNHVIMLTLNFNL